MKYWYLFYEYYCPMCNSVKVQKERVYGTPKPEEWEKRHIWIEVYDGCME